MDEPRTFTLAEAAEATGLSVDALRHRIRRGKLRAFRGNDGMVRLRLDAATLDALRAAGRATEPLAETDSQLHSRL